MHRCTPRRDPTLAGAQRGGKTRNHTVCRGAIAPVLAVKRLGAVQREYGTLFFEGELADMLVKFLTWIDERLSEDDRNVPHPATPLPFPQISGPPSRPRPRRPCANLWGNPPTRRRLRTAAALPRRQRGRPAPCAARAANASRPPQRLGREPWYPEYLPAMACSDVVAFLGPKAPPP